MFGFVNLKVALLALGFLPIHATGIFADSISVETINTRGDCSPIFINNVGNVDIKCGTTAEQAYWDAISKSIRIADFENYLGRYPKGRFVEAARLRLEELSANYSTAISHLNSAQHHIRAVGGGGEAAFVKQQHDYALSDLRLAVESYPYFSEVYFEIGKIHWWREDYTAALESLKRATSINPSYSEAYLYEGFSYENLGERALACQSYFSFLATNNYLSNDKFQHFGFVMGAFSDDFLLAKGCRAPDGFKMGRELNEFQQPLDCETTVWEDELEKCFNSGNARAMHLKAERTWIDAWNQQNKDTGRVALDIWKKLAERGDPRGYWGVAWIMEHNLVVPPDCETMIDYYQRSTDAEFVDGIVGLARLYTDELCVDRDIPRARRLYARAAALGDRHAESMIQNIDSCPSNPKHWLQPCK